jgi:uncharacterized protein YukE
MQAEIINKYEVAYRESVALISTKDEEISDLQKEKDEKSTEIESLVSDLASKQTDLQKIISTAAKYEEQYNQKVSELNLFKTNLTSSET